MAVVREVRAEENALRVDESTTLTVAEAIDVGEGGGTFAASTEYEPTGTAPTARLVENAPVVDAFTVVNGSPKT